MTLTPEAARAVALRAIPLLDLTDLGDACAAHDIDALCAQAREAGCAAVCVWPQYVGQAAGLLRGSPVRVATVVNFPAGGEDAERAAEDAAGALRDGAHEIDVVLPYRALMRGDEAAARAVLDTVREVTDGGRALKVILETGVLGTPDLIAAAGRLALAAGADFLKTSTGKTEVSATPKAAETLLGLVRAHLGERPVGLKVSGGVRTLAQAAAYLELADRTMGPDWVSPRTFRFGASALLAALRKAEAAA
jgi:deoxyribose-phosphate aldolase